MKYCHISLLFFFAFLLFGCESYVNVKTQGTLVPDEIINYRYLLNNTSQWEIGPCMGDVASDDINIIDGSAQQKSLSGSDYYSWFPNTYTWQSTIYPIGGYYQTDYDWNAMYNTITYANVVINEISSCKDGTAAQKAEYTAEALVHRADAYLMLVNQYAKPYNASTASSDPGVPLVITEDTKQSLARASIQAIYDQIIADLEAALPSLPNTQTYTTLPTKASAYGVLARAYLCIGDYAKANEYADDALAIRNTLNDLSNITELSTSTYPIRLKDPEILLSKVAYGYASAYSPTVLRLSDDLLNLFDTNDKRYTLFTCDKNNVSSSYSDVDGRYFFKDIAMNEPRNIGPSVPEMMLIKAEYFARNNKPADAMIWVNNLRKKRFAAADYVELTASTTDDALAKVIDERHREFFCRMLHWWDMRRLKDDSHFAKTITRTYGGKTYTLAPTSNRYVLPIPAYQILLNPEIEQNPE